jgi:hypothetical protein
VRLKKLRVNTLRWNRPGWRKLRWALMIVGALTLTVAILAVTRPNTTTTSWAPDSVAPQGARAVARVLGRHGVEVHHVTTVADAAGRAAPGTTLLVTPSWWLSDEQAQVMADTEADLVLLDPVPALVAEFWPDDAVLSPPPFSSPAPSPAVPSPTAPSPRVFSSEAFFPTDQGEVARLSGDRSVVAFRSGSFLTNQYITEGNNAQVALRELGRNPTLVWLVQESADLTKGVDPGSPGASVVPPWAPLVALWAVLCVVVAALWQGRRFGSLVSEPMRVVIPSAETAHGLARLYRRSRDFHHTAAALRAGTAARLAAHLGVPMSATPDAVVAAILQVVAPHLTEVQVNAVLFGPDPTTDAELAHLVTELDSLQQKVLHP